MKCRCGAPVHAVPAAIDLSATPALSGRLLQCEAGHALRLLHRKPMNWAHPRRHRRLT